MATETQIVIATYNCRGIRNNVLYIKELLFQNQISVLIIQEHWLEKLELDILLDQFKNTHKFFSTYANVSATSGRRSGGVTILIQKDLFPLFTVENCSSNRLIVLTFAKRGLQPLRIIGGYFPANNGKVACKEEYDEFLHILDAHIAVATESRMPIIVAADFNADVGSLETYTRGSQKGNSSKFGKMLKDRIINKFDLKVVDLLEGTKGPEVTFRFKDRYGNTLRSSYIDHILITEDLQPFITNSEVYEEHPLSTSDHVPVQCNIVLKSSKRVEDSLPTEKLNRPIWNFKKATKEQLIKYKKEVTKKLQRIYDGTTKTFPDIKSTETALNLLTGTIFDSAITHIPYMYETKPKRKSKDHNIKRQIKGQKL